MSKVESQAALKRFLDRLQRNRRVRLGIGVAIIALLLGVAVRAGLTFLPKEYELSICGGDLVNNRHHIARVLQREGLKNGLFLTIKPTAGTHAVLEKVSSGEVDVAFIQGGLDEKYPNVEHVASVMPEMLHLLIKNDLVKKDGGKDREPILDDLRGHSVNFSGKKSGTREVSHKIMEFAEIEHGFHYAETNYEAEQLLALPDRKMPAGIFTVSSVPSHLVEELVTERGYTVAAIPFPQSLALRFGWAGMGKILAYTYDIQPPAPSSDITTVSINMYLVANKNVDPDAIEKLLEVFFSPSVESQLGVQLEEKNITQPSGYPVSAGTTLFLKRNDSLLNPQTFSKLQGMFGLAMTFSGILLVVIKWFRGPRDDQPEAYDKEFLGYLAEVASLQRELEVATTGAEQRRRRLTDLYLHMLERYPKVTLTDDSLFDRCVRAARAAMERGGVAHRRES